MLTLTTQPVKGEDGNRSYAADAMRSLGEVRAAAGDLPQARAAWLRALTILRDLDPPDAARLQAQLDSLG